jgi:hypothetical protein
MIITAGWYGDAIAGSGNEQSGRRIKCCQIECRLSDDWCRGALAGNGAGKDRPRENIVVPAISRIKKLHSAEVINES